MTTANIIQSPIPLFLDSSGAPLSGGSIYFGLVGQNPETSPLPIYWDVAATQPAAQPIKTINGQPCRNGIQASVFTTANNYSISVKDKTGKLIYALSDATTSASLPGLSAAVAAAVSGLTSGFAVNGSNSDISSLNALASINGGQIAGLRNRIINGGFCVWQRGTSFNLSPAGAYLADRWYGASTGATVSVARGTGYSSSYGLVISGAAGFSYGYLAQRIESINAYSLVNNKCTVSLRIFNNSTAIPAVLALSYPTVQDNFASIVPIESKAISIVNGWNYFTFTTTNILPTGVTAGLQFEIDFTNGIANGTSISISDVQLELGSVASIFEQRHVGLETSNCLRYVRPIATQSCPGMAYSTTNASVFSFGLPLRATPSLSTTSGFSLLTASGASQPVTALSVGGLSPDGTVQLFATTASGLVAGNATYISAAPSPAFLSAEL